jgi:serine/threonine-protein kinase
MIGSTIGNYQVVRRLGEGGMGTVYAAIDLMLEREVALKVLRPELAGQADIADRFRAEAVTLARLQHPHIATLYSLAREAGELMMVMELVDGDTLERILQRTGPLPAGTAVRWCREVLEAMAYAHRKGVVHRDIKPANVMITMDGTVKVTDFGIARVLGGTHRTRTGHIIGTAAYMAPEQIRGREVDARTDIYALASVLFELLTGRPPFEAEDEFGLMTAQVTGAPPSARALGAQVPQWLDEAILRGLAKAPDARFQTATAFGDVLAEGLRASALPDAEPGVFLPAAPAPADRDLNTGGPPTTRLAATPHPTAPGLASAHTTPPTRLAAPPAASMSWPAYCADCIRQAYLSSS